MAKAKPTKSSRSQFTQKADIPDAELQKDLKTFWKDQRSNLELGLDFSDPARPRSVLHGHAGFNCPGIAPEGSDHTCHGQGTFQFLSGSVFVAAASVIALYCPQCQRATRIEREFFQPVLKADLEVRQLELAAHDEVAAIEAEDAPMDMTEVEEVLDGDEA